MNLYKIHAINFLHHFNYFFGSEMIPRQAETMPCFVLLKIGYNYVIVKSKVRRRYVLKLAQYLLHHNPAYARYVLSEYAVNALPDNSVLQSVIVYYDMDEDASGENQ